MKKVRRNKPKLVFRGPVLGPEKLSYTWELRAGNGKIMASGREYGRRSDSKRAAWVVRWLYSTHRLVLNPYRRSK